uniref:Uncharacterized protein n=1 Tax=Bubo bubo TaxID=30461 RepID=A0A8C0IET6_BUBBB
MGLRWILSRQPNTDPIFRPTLPPPLLNCKSHTHPPHLPPRLRLKQPTRNHIRLRQNPIPPLLLYKRHPRTCTNAPPPNNLSLILTHPTRRPRKLYTSKPPSHPSPHQTRMVLPICLRHFTLNPQ